MKILTNKKVELNIFFERSGNQWHIDSIKTRCIICNGILPMDQKYTPACDLCYSITHPVIIKKIFTAAYNFADELRSQARGRSTGWKRNVKFEVPQSLLDMHNKDIERSINRSNTLFHNRLLKGKKKR